MEAPEQYRYREYAKGSHAGFRFKNGWLYTAEDQLLLPDDYLDLICEEYHNRFGHLGVQRTLARIKKNFWSPKLQAAVTKHIANCDICQRSKGSTQKPAGLLQPLPTPAGPWQDIAMDFLTDLPLTTSGHTGVLVVIDRFSKMARFLPTAEPATAEVVANLLFKEIISKHGLPRSITSDRDTRFTSNLWSQLWKKFNTSLNMSTAFHPQTDGQSERTIRTLE